MKVAVDRFRLKLSFRRNALGVLSNIFRGWVGRSMPGRLPKTTAKLPQRTLVDVDPDQNEDSAKPPQPSRQLREFVGGDADGCLILLCGGDYLEVAKEIRRAFAHPSSHVLQTIEWVVRIPECETERLEDLEVEPAQGA